MTVRLRAWLAAFISVVLLAGAAWYGVASWTDYRARATAPSQEQAVAAQTRPPGDRVVFRNTASGSGYGLVASVPLTDPSGPRSVTDVACDRVYATSAVQSCLHTDRGVITTFHATITDASGRELRAWPLTGIPSRTRVSSDSTLVAVTAFVTGESYASVGFATMTTISSTDGTVDSGNLEDFALLVDGTPLTAADRNIWGVTFGADGNSFYATAASGSQTWLVQGDLAARTLTAIRENAECPSLSPDGQRIAYKKATAGSASAWAIAVWDLATGAETILPEARSVDDQVVWLDDGTLLYGLAREGAVGDSDIWSVAADGRTDPVLYLAHAWSPSVVR